jgi:hypothetical protein
VASDTLDLATEEVTAILATVWDMEDSMDDKS